jgi:TetR/AcrR family transcriptional repressor of nem operon
MRITRASSRHPDAPALARILFAYGEGLLLHARMWNDLSHLNEMEAGARRILGVKANE